MKICMITKGGASELIHTNTDLIDFFPKLHWLL